MADTIQALGRASELLVCLDEQGREVSVAQIASDMGIYKSTVFHTLSTLETRRFVSRNPETEKYWLGSQLSVLGKSIENRTGIQEVMRPYTRRLHQKYHEVVSVSILEHNPGDVYHSAIILKEMSDQQLLTVSPSVGSLSEYRCSAIGKHLPAFGDNIGWTPYEEQELTRYTVNIILSYKDLKEEIGKVRRRSHAINHEKQEMGLTCVGAPTLDRNKKAIVTISLSGPTGHMNSSNLENRIEAVRNAARDISGSFQGYLRLPARHGRGEKTNCTESI